MAEKFSAGCSKSSQRRGARKIDERRRTRTVRWSEAIERNEAYEAFSAACSDRSFTQARSSVGERFLDTEEVGSSILPVPTIFT